MKAKLVYKMENREQQTGKKKKSDREREREHGIIIETQFEMYASAKIRWQLKNVCKEYNMICKTVGMIAFTLFCWN